MTSPLTRKAHSKSIIASMTREQRDKLESWLFDENISYPAASTRCQEEFKVTLSYQSVRRFYQKLAEKRALDRIIHSPRATNAILETFDKNPAKTAEAVLKLVAQIAFNAASKSGDQVDLKTIRDLTGLLLTARRDDAFAQHFALEREKWEFDVARTTAQHFNDLKALMAEDSDDEDARLLRIRQRLFGTNLPE